ncbi:hypothetical protein E2320_003541 [Naja naja]|nr:hypothetical protein E2320_003541 [Naja naja]
MILGGFTSFLLSVDREQSFKKLTSIAEMVNLIPKYVQQPLSMYFALDEINKNVKLFPNITLALEIYETSFNAWQTNKNILDFLFLNRRSPVNFNCGRRREMDFLPIIGDLISLNSIQMAHILNIYKFPQLHYFMRNTHFNNTVGEEIFFDEKGEFDPGYDLFNFVSFHNQSFQRFQIGRMVSKGPDGKKFTVNKSAILWNHKFQQVEYLVYSNSVDYYLEGKRFFSYDLEAQKLSIVLIS